MGIITLVLCIHKCDSYLAHQIKLRNERNECGAMPILHGTPSISALIQKINFVAKTALGSRLFSLVDVVFPIQIMCDDTKEV